MSLTPNFGLNIPDAGDIVNLLTQCYPNFTLIDTAMQAIKETGVTSATETKSGTTHQIVRTVADCNVLRFTATSNFVTGDTFTVDGVPVTGVAVNGTSLQTGDFVINSDVMAILNGGKLTLLTGGSGANDASDVSYDNTGSGLTATNVQDALDEIYASITPQGVLYKVTSNGNNTATIEKDGVAMGTITTAQTYADSLIYVHYTNSAFYVTLKYNAYVDGVPTAQNADLVALLVNITQSWMGRIIATP